MQNKKQWKIHFKKTAKMAVMFMVFAFILIYVSAALLFVIDNLLHGNSFVKKVFYYETELPILFISILYTVCGSLLGCGVLAIISFHKHTAVENNFELQHVWGYFFAPWLAVVLGLIVFAFMQSGLLIFAQTSPTNTQNPSSDLGYLSVGFLAGFGWFRLTKFIELMVTRVFVMNPAERINEGQEKEKKEEEEEKE